MADSKIYTDQQLFASISEGSEEAFNQFYTSVLPEFAPYLHKLLKTEEAVKEVLQEALVRLWMSRPKLPEINHPKAWFLKIISNECYRYLSKQSDRLRQVKRLEEQARLRSAEQRQTEMDLSFRETQRVVRKAAAALPPRQQMVYQLSRDEGLSIPEIADKLGLSPDYVKKALMSALRTIQQKLIDAGRLLPLAVLLLVRNIFSA